MKDRASSSEIYSSVTEYTTSQLSNTSHV